MIPSAFGKWGATWISCGISIRNPSRRLALAALAAAAGAASTATVQVPPHVQHVRALRPTGCLSRKLAFKGSADLSSAELKSQSHHIVYRRNIISCFDLYWVSGPGAMMVGHERFCSLEHGCKPCPVCNGQGEVKCFHCKGTGMRAGWLDEGCPVDPGL